MLTIDIPECDLLSIGLSVLDSNFFIAKLPEKDEKCEAHKISESLGGPACIASLVSNALGLKTILISALGQDSAGLHILESNKQAKHNLFPLPSSHSSKASIWIEDSGQRSLIVKEASYTHNFNITGPVPRFILTDGRYIKNCYESLLKMQSLGSQIILDAGSTNDGILSLLPHCDHLICSRKFALTYTKCPNIDQAFDKLTQEFSQFTITLGPEGSLSFLQNKKIPLPAQEVKVINSNGAGDVFHGAFIAHYAKEGDFLKAIKYAGYQASQHCTNESIEESLRKLRLISSVQN